MESKSSPGRPLKPLDPDASAGARLGAELRSRRLAQSLTLEALADLIDYSPQHVSEVERANVTPSRPFIATCDRVLDAQGALVALLPAVIDERAQQSDNRSVGRRAILDPALSRVAAPATAREVDPELPTHCAQLLKPAGTTRRRVRAARRARHHPR
jgi:transcriptional regulator with XRE-family HTH domain